MKRLYLKIFGLVQDVSFRWYARGEARRLGLTGWVKNMPDGTVEIVAEGEENRLLQFRDWCKAGPRWSWPRQGGARVDKIEEGWGEGGGEFESFFIR